MYSLLPRWLHKQMFSDHMLNGKKFLMEKQLVYNISLNRSRWKKWEKQKRNVNQIMFNYLLLLYAHSPSIIMYASILLGTLNARDSLWIYVLLSMCIYWSACQLHFHPSTAFPHITSRCHDKWTIQTFLSSPKQLWFQEWWSLKPQIQPLSIGTRLIVEKFYY